MADNKFCCNNPKQQVIYYFYYLKKNAIAFIQEIFIRVFFVIALFHYSRFKKTEKQFFGFIKYFSIITDETRIREIVEHYSEVDVT